MLAVQDGKAIDHPQVKDSSKLICQPNKMDEIDIQSVNGGKK